MYIVVIVDMIDMCNHNLHYMLKKHEDGSYAGIMLELQGVLAHAKSKEEVESKLIKTSLHVFHVFDDIHKKALNHTLNSSMCKSTMGIPQEINMLTVECPPNGT